jgi:thiol:disulfide interchange protein DsbD
MYISSVWLLWVLAREAGVNAVSITLLGMVLITFAFWLWQRDSSFARLLSLLIAVAGIAATMNVVYPPPPAGNTLKGHSETFSPSRLEELRKQGSAVFVDATADWCITCKVNETLALSSPAIMQVFAQKHITVMIADWTHSDADITQYLESFGRRGVPLYVYYPPKNGEPVVLPQLLSEGTVMKAITP